MSRTLEIPRFHKEHLNSRLMPGDLGDAFQSFVHELLIFDYPDLQFFPAGGKDGCIDLTQTTDTSRLVVECKHIGKDSVDETRGRWASVADKLTKHLADPQGPTKFQAQYGPWYRMNPAIDEYIFCISSVLANQEQHDSLLQKEIGRFFTALGTAHSHLSHLTKLSVKVLDWNGLCARLQKHPHLIYRWFPLTRPHGFIPLEDSFDRGTFRSYLSSDKLAYYGRGQHLRAIPAPHGIVIPDEDNLLKQIGDGEATGLIVTGSGGVGKTRLTVEIGRLAQRKGWAVLRVQSRWREDALEQLAERFTPDNPVLLLIDYIETQKDFAELVESLNAINDNYSLRLRYVANCRTSYYSTVSAITRHHRVDLSPIEQDSAGVWVESYQQQTVRHILESSGINITDEHLKVSRGIPILAVFVSYLHTTHRQIELAELLKEEDFSAWVAKRMALSLQDVGFPVDRHLALFMALFPLPNVALSHLAPQIYGRLLDKLAADGWVEKLPPDEFHEVETWVTAHDVLADQILLSFLDSVRETVERFIRELLSLARETDCLRSALITLQRLADQPLLKALDWISLLDDEMDQHPVAWREVRSILIRAPLLTPLQKIKQLGKHEEVWKGAEEEINFQNSLGWLARWAIKEEVESRCLDVSCRSILETWVQKAARWATQSNFVITGGIRLCPDAVRESALNWMLTRSGDFQTHYLLVAWLKQGLPIQAVASPVQYWATKFCITSNFSFLAHAWLDAGGDKDAVKEPMLAWLNKHGTEAAARFVYHAWLSAGGDKDAVKEPMLAWLREHRTDDTAQFVYKAWLDAGGDKDVLLEPLAAWLKEHGTEVKAGFVYGIWLNAGGSTDVVLEPMPTWLNEHVINVDASFVYRAWLNSGGNKDSVKEPMLAWLKEHGADDTAQFVYHAWLSAGGDKDAVKEPMLAWLNKHGTEAAANFIYRGWLDAGGSTDVVLEPMLAWLGTHKTDADASFVYRGWLEAGGDKDVVRESMLTWLEEYGMHVDAQFVYNAWLEADGEFSLIRLSVIQWLGLHHDKYQAVYPTKILSKQPGLPIGAVVDILKWCRKFLTDPDVLWRLTRLGKNLQREGIAEDVVATSEAVIASKLSNKEALTLEASGQITTLLAYLIEAPTLLSGQLRSRADALLLEWLRASTAFGDDPKPHSNIQRARYVQRVVDLIVSGALDVSIDREPLERFLHWANHWNSDRKVGIQPKIEFLSRKYPAPGLWDIVHFD